MKKNWNLWVGLLVAIGVAWYNGYDKSKMDNFSSFLILLVTIVGFLSFLKTLTTTKSKELMESNTTSQKTRVSYIEVASNPYKQGQNLAKDIATTIEILREKKAMNKVKKFFKWLYFNKCTITNIVVSIACVAFVNFMSLWGYLDRYQIFQTNPVLFKVIIGVGGVLWTALSVFCSINKLGAENLSEIDARLQAKANEKLSRLTPEQRKLVKENIKNLQEQLNKLKVESDGAMKKVQSFTVLKSIEGFDVSNQVESYEKACAIVSNNSSLITKLENEIAILKGKL